MSQVDLPVLKRIDESSEDGLPLSRIEQIEQSLTQKYGVGNVHSLYISSTDPAYFIAELEIDGDGDTRQEEIYIRFSRFGRLCAIVCAQKIIKTEQEALETLVQEAGAYLVHEKWLNSDYDGNHPLVGFPTWWDRYFDFTF